MTCRRDRGNEIVFNITTYIDFILNIKGKREVWGRGRGKEAGRGEGQRKEGGRDRVREGGGTE